VVREHEHADRGMAAADLLGGHEAPRRSGPAASGCRSARGRAAARRRGAAGPPRRPPCRRPRSPRRRAGAPEPVGRARLWLRCVPCVVPWVSSTDPIEFSCPSRPSLAYRSWRRRKRRPVAVTAFDSGRARDSRCLDPFERRGRCAPDARPHWS
jgi:hypothetical protein